MRNLTRTIDSISRDHSTLDRPVTTGNPLDDIRRDMTRDILKNTQGQAVMTVTRKTRTSEKPTSLLNMLSSIGVTWEKKCGLLEVGLSIN